MTGALRKIGSSVYARESGMRNQTRILVSIRRACLHWKSSFHLRSLFCPRLIGLLVLPSLLDCAPNLVHEVRHRLGECPPRCLLEFVGLRFADLLDRRPIPVGILVMAKRGREGVDVSAGELKHLRRDLVCLGCSQEVRGLHFVPVEQWAEG